jgi:hypothetical protein
VAERQGKDYRLRCTRFVVDVPASAVISVHADFIIPVAGSSGAEEIAEALQRAVFTLANGDGIDLVKSSGKPRCFYCGSLNEEDAIKCAACGASL